MPGSLPLRGGGTAGGAAPIAVAGALAGAALLLAYWLGANSPAPNQSITDDRLGPESGQPVGDYLAVAAESLRADADDDLRWALISPRHPWSPADVWRQFGATAGLPRIGQVLVRVEIAGVGTPTVSVTPGQSESGLAAVNELAALAAPELVAPTDRGAAIARVVSSRLRTGTPAVVGVVVRGTGAALRSVSAQPAVRAVQVLPDANGEFAVAPLLPSDTERAEPGADDAPVPTA